MENENDEKNVEFGISGHSQSQTDDDGLESPKKG